jgi:oxygen-independent coproporphyrinogen III oxidase
LPTVIEVTPELLARHERPGPRYTSYPTAMEFSENFDASQYATRLAGASQRESDPLSLYLHLPFCQARCSFCACHVVVTQRAEVSDAYLGRVVAEAALIGERLGDRRQLVQYHWGGGTPTYYRPEVLLDLHRRVLAHFELAPDAELAIEVDPRVTTPAHLQALTEAGFNRVSLGVQDLDSEVQQLIGRHQTEEDTVTLYTEARRLGFESINLDLIYGLPGQDEDTIERTLDIATGLRPDRLAVYGFAFVPWMRPHQKRMDEGRLPDTESRFRLLARVVSRLTAAGYRQIGMDHFALPADELAAAADQGTLTRNFMGYTTKRNTEVVALGTSGISDLDGAYAQNHRRLASYYTDVDAGRLPIERGFVLSAEDRLRRHLITELMCNGQVDLAAVASEFGGEGPEMFCEELAELTEPGGLVDEGMATVDGWKIEATELGMLFVRRLARILDAHTARRRDDRPVFSKSI